MNTQDIRWEKSFNSYVRALERLSDAVRHCEEARHRVERSNDLEEEKRFNTLKAGLIKFFECVLELSWKTMKDYMKFLGAKKTGKSKNIFDKAFKKNLIDDKEVWIDMVDSRNETAHDYEEKKVDVIYEKIINDYYPAFMEMKKTFDEIYNKRD